MMLWSDDGSARVWVEVEGPRTILVGLVLLGVWTALAVVGGLTWGLELHAEATERAIDTADYYSDQRDSLAVRLSGHLGVSEEAVRACLMTDARLLTLLGETPARIDWASDVLAGRDAP